MSKENFSEKMKVAKEAKKIKEEIQINDVILEEIKEPIKITSTEIQVTSSEFHNFGNAVFEKNKLTFLTEKVLSDLEKLPNFKDLVDKGVIKIGL